MTDAPSIGLAIAFAAGLLSFLSPCVLPLIPSYVTFISGMSLDDVSRARRTAFIHSLLFVLGFTIIFLALGATATTIGRALGYYREWIGRIGGALLVVFGLYMLGVFNIAAFQNEKRFHVANKPAGYLGTVLVGLAFGAGWTPCIGPILGGVLTYTASSADLSRGLVLLLAYSMGLAIPFLLASLAIERFLALFKRFRGGMVWINRIAGVLLIVVGVLLMTNYLTFLSSYLQSMTPEFLRSRL
ncbi:MAG TPA: cytochrome c biogenesis protein CcdA [Gemmatimonadaceae bacterium]|nr:cytochrome c biogenesis protein CcdA [Gemmatimonadaceae bacterium]